MILSTIQLVKNVMRSFTVRTVSRDIRLMFMLSHNPQTCHNCDKDFLSVDSLQIRMADVHDQCEKDAETEYDFNMEEEFYTDYAYIPCLCQLKIKNQNNEKTMRCCPPPNLR